MEILKIDSTTTRPFQSFKHAARAAAVVRESSFSLEFIHVTKEHIIGTNGHRLHIADNTLEFTPGYYRIVSNRKDTIILHREMESEELSFPDYKETIKSLEGEKELDFNGFASDLAEIAYSQIARALPVEKALDFQYFRQAFVYTSQGFSILADGAAVLMHGLFTKSYIMAIKAD